MGCNLVATYFPSPADKGLLVTLSQQQIEHTHTHTHTHTQYTAFGCLIFRKLALPPPPRSPGKSNQFLHLPFQASWGQCDKPKGPGGVIKGFILQLFCFYGNPVTFKGKLASFFESGCHFCPFIIWMSHIIWCECYEAEMELWRSVLFYWYFHSDLMFMSLPRAVQSRDAWEAALKL